LSVVVRAEWIALAELESIAASSIGKSHRRSLKLMHATLFSDPRPSAPIRVDLRLGFAVGFGLVKLSGRSR